MALHPPSPKSCRNTTRTWGIAAKRISASSWGQYVSFRWSSDEKSTNHHFKNSPRVRWANAHRIVVNKIKVLLVSSIKITSPDRDDCDRIRDVRRSHSPVKLEPLGAGWLWRTMVTMFCCLWGVVCVCLLSPARGGERREILGRWSLLGLQLKI